ncbi:hypothetical protein BGZ61DRAFT_448708 [Ilyonectria robusta]|uniref:uncharacterized protein n=1 Tax=Ilyonectria robusta TaxID=1079257 RepID=UPI001E8E36EE|nr:uncharacterized protein BGZ61DRAFT_448708 [Ilyonectria robusta]KAH8714242.1 hypothetical protein BGZ61DRAFT_448708 [Ilyonectria robusta]
MPFALRSRLLGQFSRALITGVPNHNLMIGCMHLVQEGNRSMVDRNLAQHSFGPFCLSLSIDT